MGKFDFSKPDDQKQFGSLPHQAKEILIDASRLEANEINESKRKEEEQLEKNKQLELAEQKLQEEYKKDLPIFKQKLEVLITEIISKGLNVNKDHIAAAYEKLGDNSKALEVRREYLKELFGTITKYKQELREKDEELSRDLENNYVILDEGVGSRQSGFLFKKEILSVEKLKKDKQDLREKINNNKYFGKKEDYLLFLDQAEKIGAERLSELEKNNLGNVKNDMREMGWSKIEKDTKEEIEGKLYRTEHFGGGGGMFGAPRQVYDNDFKDIGILYKKIGEFDKAREMFQKYIDVYDNQKFDTSRAEVGRRTLGPTVKEREKDLSEARNELISLPVSVIQENNPSSNRKYLESLIEKLESAN